MIVEALGASNGEWVNERGIVDALGFVDALGTGSMFRAPNAFEGSDELGIVDAPEIGDMSRARNALEVPDVSGPPNEVPDMSGPPNGYELPDRGPRGIPNAFLFSIMLWALDRLGVVAGLGIGVSGAVDALGSSDVLLVPSIPVLVVSYVGDSIVEQSARRMAWQLPSRTENLPFWTHLRQRPFNVFSIAVAASCSLCLKSVRVQSHAENPPNISRSPCVFWYFLNLTSVDLTVDSRMLSVMGQRPTRESSRK